MTVKKMTRAQAINAYCKECNFDPKDKGTWRQQVDSCTSTECPLHTFRPRSYKKVVNNVED